MLLDPLSRLMQQLLQGQHLQSRYSQLAPIERGCSKLPSGEMGCSKLGPTLVHQRVWLLLLCCLHSAQLCLAQLLQMPWVECLQQRLQWFVSGRQEPRVQGACQCCWSSRSAALILCLGVSACPRAHALLLPRGTAGSRRLGSLSWP